MPEGGVNSENGEGNDTVQERGEEEENATKIHQSIIPSDNSEHES